MINFLVTERRYRDATGIRVWKDMEALKVIKPYGKHSKISNTFLFLFSNKVSVVRAEIHIKLVRIVK